MANRDEVEEFLRRAAARRAAAQQQQQRPPAPPPPPRPQQTFPQQLQPQQSFPQQPQRRTASLAEVVMLQPVEPLEAEVVDAELAEQPDRLGKYIAQDLRGAEEIAEHTRHLGEEVDQADDKLEAHLHQVFDHKLGQLKKSTMEPAAASPSQAARDAALPGAASIAHLLVDPQNVRNAVILAEILRRPEDSW
ncbi:MAG: hypothetical protein L0211_12550 [Planctomycetaceae bacterium]|nr:hypothetical protein [Planctomycetaceae bacterium]